MLFSLWKVISIRSILVMLFVALSLASCGPTDNLSLEIKEIITDLTTIKVVYDFTPSLGRNPSLLVTEGRVPQSTSDGILLDGPDPTFVLPEAGKYDLYFTLVEKNRFVSPPVAKEVNAFSDKPERPDFDFSIQSGILTVQLSSIDDSITCYFVEYAGSEYSSKDGQFSFEVTRGKEVTLRAWSVRQDGSPSDPIEEILDLSIDNPPEVSLKVPKPYVGNVIQVELADDWDQPEDLEVIASSGDYRFYFNESVLYPEVQLPEGSHFIIVSVIDSSGNMTNKTTPVYVTKTPSPRIPELLIEEGTFRRAIWQFEDASIKLQRFWNGAWIDHIVPQEGVSSVVISREGMSERGDFYRIHASSPEHLYIPSIPVFAKESQFRRFTAENVVSFMGSDALLSTGNTFRLVGNLTVWQGTVVRIEPGVEFVFPRGNNLIVSGVLDIDGRQNRVSISSPSVMGTISVTQGGSIIARGVDFSRTRLVVRGANIVVLEDCVLSDGLRIDGARSVQIYSSKILSSFFIGNADEVFIDGSIVNAETITLTHSAFVSISRSDMSADEIVIEQSNVRFIDSSIEAQLSVTERFSAVVMAKCSLSVGAFTILSGSSVQIENPKIMVDESQVSLANFSRLSFSEYALKSLRIVADRTSIATAFK